MFRQFPHPFWDCEVGLAKVYRQGDDRSQATFMTVFSGQARGLQAATTGAGPWPCRKGDEKRLGDGSQ